MGNKKISLWQLLEKQSVEIPIIQRDFAQGRAGNEHLRARFLKSLKNALDTSNELVLDFVYGSEASERFQPLDGQQRLTTLWLLHWYIALRAGELSEVGKRLSNFTYETRISSREFCQQLCDANNFNGFDGKDILGFIEKQTWFYSAWKQDPTIRSILRMLGGCRNTTGYGEDNIYDGIEKLFREEDNFEEYWKDLTSDKPVITFYYLSLRDFGLSDDLYIKMNARGKQLTAFENFKADLIGYIGKQAQETKDDDQKEKWQNFLDPEKGIPIKLDTKWTDLFWKNGGDAKSRQVDERFFAFLNRFFLNHKLAEINGEDDKYYSYLTNKGKENDTQIQYQGIEPYLWKKDVKEGSITYGLFDDLNTIMDNYIASDVQPTDFTCEWNKSFRFIPEYKEDKVTSINQVERVVFYAICKYFKQDKVEENTDKQSLKRWMRVVWNLVSVEDSDGGKAIRTVSEMKNSVAIINNLKSHDVYTSMKNESDEYGENDNLLMKQFKEEVFKAKKISEDNNWENKFIDAEKHAFFNGCICFLLRDEDGSWRIDDFERKWDNAQKFFDNEGVTKEYSINAKLLKAFLYHLGKEKAMEENNFIFDHTKETWRNRILIRK
ncbi:MAG: DUF262 domain-containing protein, partial [Clostridiales bacterium]|nr:DUF262 domain-containing protein [Clostridiales bacterium]